MDYYSQVCTSHAITPLHLVGKTGQAVEISIHTPSPYICANCEQVLPDWKQQQFLWVIIVLQQSKYPLEEITTATEIAKEKLREKFMRFGCDVAFNLRDRGYITDLIDPRTGYPLLSHSGLIPHDDTAVAQALLKYPTIENKCHVLVHPQWGSAVYPSIMLSEAPPEILELVMKSIALMHGWIEIGEEKIEESEDRGVSSREQEAVGREQGERILTPHTAHRIPHPIRYI